MELLLTEMGKTIVETSLREGLSRVHMRGLDWREVFILPIALRSFRRGRKELMSKTIEVLMELKGPNRKEVLPGGLRTLRS